MDNINNMGSKFSDNNNNIREFNNIKKEFEEIDSYLALEHGKFISDLFDVSKDNKVLDYDYKRRINQCLNLANKVKMLSVENEKLKLINDKINKELQNMSDQCNIYKNVTDQVKQPTAVLISNIQEKEIEIYKLKQDIIDKDQENNKLRQKKMDRFGYKAGDRIELTDYAEDGTQTKKEKR